MENLKEGDIITMTNSGDLDGIYVIVGVSPDHDLLDPSVTYHTRPLIHIDQVAREDQK